MSVFQTIINLDVLLLVMGFHMQEIPGTSGSMTDSTRRHRQETRSKKVVTHLDQFSRLIFRQEIILISELFTDQPFTGRKLQTNSNMNI